MPAIEIGRICTKTAGRETGKKCVVVDVMDKNFALITGPQEFTGVKRRRANINHLTPTDEKIEIRKGASDDDVGKLLEKTGWSRQEKKRVVEKPAQVKEKAKPPEVKRKAKAPEVKEKKAKAKPETRRRKKKE